MHMTCLLYNAQRLERMQISSCLRDGSRTDGWGDILEDPLDLTAAAREWMAPKVILGIFDQLDEASQETKRMRALGNEALKQYPCDLFLDTLFTFIE